MLGIFGLTKITLAACVFMYIVAASVGNAGGGWNGGHIAQCICYRDF